MSSRTTVSAWSYLATPSMIGQSVPHINRRGPKVLYSRFTSSCESSHGYGWRESDHVCEVFTNTFGKRFNAISFSNSRGWFTGQSAMWSITSVRSGSFSIN
jgi:hypothetical protein